METPVTFLAQLVSQDQEAGTVTLNLNLTAESVIMTNVQVRDLTTESLRDLTTVEGQLFDQVIDEFNRTLIGLALAKCIVQ